MPSDHLSLSNRSHAYSLLERYNEALADAEQVIKLRPDWPKVYICVEEIFDWLIIVPMWKISILRQKIIFFPILGGAHAGYASPPGSAPACNGI